MEMLPAYAPEVLAEKLRITKWDCMDFPEDIPAQHKIAHEMFQDSFSYVPGPPENTEWHVNFADARLFGFYEGPLFAQDEIQVMEHPCLASVRNALSDIAETQKEANPYTRSSHGSHMYSTPILIKGAKRRVSVATNVDAEAGRPEGLYGRMFSYASPEAVLSALTVIDPPTTTNLIAIEAPKGGFAEYTREQIGDAFGTAFTGFLAARVESKEENPDTKVVVHTGNWGTGAFGGNRILMACIQLVAAHVAEVDKLVFHTFEPAATEAYFKGKILYEKLLNENTNVDAVLEALFQKEFMWGFSDGN
eukprot:Phypoly_transcript_12257.p1 GENE.Phypoly_transcript_12257~~Phypoly_transcript_12257.p1  ORF type:complete len:358 (+),score=63.31 Phypoly_transcript_12257:158-1075(+)